MELLANDAAGLLDALNIDKANIFGYSLGSFIAQQFAIKYPEKTSSLILVASTCGGKDAIDQSPKFKKLQYELVNKTLNNVPISLEEMKSLVTASLGEGWIKLHPESLDIPAN